MLTKKTSTIKGFTDKPNSNLNIQRLYGGYEDRYETRVEAEEVDYKVPVLTDWALTSHYLVNSTHRSDFDLWSNWLNDKKILYVLSNDELVKVESVAQLRSHIRFINTPTSPEAIKTRMAEFGISADKVEVIDYFKSQQVLAKLNRNKNPGDINIFEDNYELADFNTVKLSHLILLSEKKLDDYIISLKNRAITLDFDTFKIEHESILHLFIQHDIQITGLKVDDNSTKFIVSIFSKKSELLKNVKKVYVDHENTNDYLDLLENCLQLSKLEIRSRNEKITELGAEDDSEDQINERLGVIISKLKSLRVSARSYSFIQTIVKYVPDDLEELEYQDRTDDYHDDLISKLTSKVRPSIKKLSLIGVYLSENVLKNIPKVTHFEFSSADERLDFKVTFTGELNFLKVLKLTSLEFHSDEYVNLIKQAPALEEFHVKDCIFERLDDSQQMVLPKTRLRKLYSDDNGGATIFINGLVDSCADTLEYLSLTNLYYLYSCKTEYPKLKYLKLSMSEEASQDEEPSDAIIALLQSSPNLNHLEIINFANITDADYSDFSDIKLNHLRTFIVDSFVIPCIVHTLLRATPHLENFSYTENSTDNQDECDYNDTIKNIFRNNPALTHIKQASFIRDHTDSDSDLFHQLISKMNPQCLTYTDQMNLSPADRVSLRANTLKFKNPSSYELTHIPPTASLQHLILEAGRCVVETKYLCK